MNFTTDELRTLIWALQAQHAKESLRILREGKKPSEHPTIQRLNAISKKAYAELIARDNAE